MKRTILKIFTVFFLSMVMLFNGAAVFAQPEEPQQDYAKAQVLTSNADTTGFDVEIHITDCSSIPETVKVPVWSRSDQSDLYWYTASIADTGIYTVRVDVSNHKGNAGLYYIDVYSYFANGAKVYSGGATQNVEKAVAGIASMIADASEDGTFKIELEGVEYAPGIRNVLIPVWSTKNQSDLVWYTATDEGNGRYTLSSDISKHNWNSGTYYADAYIETTTGQKLYGKTALFEVKAEDMVLKVGESRDECVYPVTLTGAANTASNVKIVVWSDKNGQDDIKWYDAKRTENGSFTAEIDIRNHRTAGKYYVEAYETGSGLKYLCGCYDFSVDPSTKAEVTPWNDKEDKGTFEVQIKLVNTTGNIDQIKVPVWSRADQSDLYWYTANRVNDQLYYVIIDTSKHKFNNGRYYIDVYGYYKNGISQYIGGNTHNVTMGSILVKKNGNEGQRSLVIRGIPAANNVIAYIWTPQNGQDDLVAYKAVKSADGSWSAAFDSSKHLNSGAYIVHVYADGVFFAGKTFEIPYSEIRNDYTDLAMNMNAGRENEQLILVDCDNLRAQVVMLNKNTDGTWFQTAENYGWIGRGGMGETTEVNGVTPQGIFGFNYAFGIYPDPGTSGFDYIKVDSSYYWVDDVNSPYYNQFVSTQNAEKNWSSAEHIIDYGAAYYYCLGIDYNPECIPGAGSAIFLHCSSGLPTGGCVAVSRETMVRILKTIRSDCKIIIDSGSGFLNY